MFNPPWLIEHLTKVTFKTALALAAAGAWMNPDMAAGAYVEPPQYI